MVKKASPNEKQLNRHILFKAECHAYQNANINSLQRSMHCCFKLESL